MAGVPHKIIPGKLGGWRPGAGRKKKLPLPDMPGVRIIDGRPIALRAREYTHLALAGLIRALCDPECPYPAVVNAAREMLDRGYGRAVELKRTLTMGAFDGYSDADLDELITRLRTIETSAPIIDGVAVQSKPAKEPDGLGDLPRPPASDPPPDAPGGTPTGR
jgi:hypothetical protein